MKEELMSGFDWGWRLEQTGLATKSLSQTAAQSCFLIAYKHAHSIVANDAPPTHTGVRTRHAHYTSQTQLRSDACMLTHVHTHTHIYAHTHTHNKDHTHTHAYDHTHTHFHSLMQASSATGSWLCPSCRYVAARCMSGYMWVLCFKCCGARYDLSTVMGCWICCRFVASWCVSHPFLYLFVFVWDAYLIVSQRLCHMFIADKNCNVRPRQHVLKFTYRAAGVCAESGSYICTRLCRLCDII